MLAAYPIAYSAWISLHKYNLKRPDVFDFIGLSNYATININDAIALDHIKPLQGRRGTVAAIEKLLVSEPAVAVDNAGARATGETRESAKVTLNNPLKMGDAASAQLLHSEGLDYQK